MLRLETLGELRLLGPAGEVLRGRRKELALLAYLASRAPRPVARDQLAALLWGEREDRLARHSLRQALTVLRPVLGDALEIRPTDVRLEDSALEQDAAAFAADVAAGRLAEGVARWRGDYLAGLDDLGAGGWRGWLEAEREALRRQLTWALARLVEGAEQREAWDEAVSWAERWAELLPLDERPVERLVRALARAGRTGEALARHALLAARWRQEGVAEPSPEYRRLAAELERSASPDPVARTEPGSAALFTPDLVGRSGALRELRAAWSAVRAGGSCVLVVEGEEGSGRTRLCDELLRGLGQERQPWLLLRARAAEAAAAPAHTARELFCPLRYAPGLAGAPDEALAEVAALVPGIRERFPRLPEPRGDGARLVPALARVLADVASEVPVLIFLDDLSVADAESQRLLLSLAGALPPGVLFLLTIVSSELRPGSPLAGFRRLPGARWLRLQPLSVEETGALLASMIVCPAEEGRTLAARVHAESGGNPLYATEIVAALVDEGWIAPDPRGYWRVSDGAGGELPVPATLREALRRRFSRLPETPRRALTVAAGLQEPWSADELGYAAALTPDELLAALDQLIGRRLVREGPTTPGRYEFVHALVRRVAREHADVQRHDRVAVAGSRPPDPRRTARRRRVIMAAAALLLVTGLVALALRPPRSLPAAGAAPLAVGMIQDHSGAPQAGAFPEMLATDLARVPSLHVVSRARIYELLGQLGSGEQRAAGLASAARAAGAGEVVEGELYRRGKGVLRLDLRRVSLRTGAVVAAYSVEAGDLFALADDATARVAEGLDRRSESQGLANVTTTSVVAYRLYEEGLRAYYQDDLNSAHRLFRAALAEDSTFAMAAYYASQVEHVLGLPVDAALERRLRALAEHAPDRERLQILGAWGTITNDPIVLPVAETLAVRYPSEPDGHLLLGWALLEAGDFTGAVPHLRRVIAMDSLGLRRATALCRACDAFRHLAAAYMHADSFPAAERAVREWARLQPGSASAWQLLAQTLDGQGRWTEALAATTRAARLVTGSEELAVYPALITIRAGRFAEADQRLRELISTVPDEARWFLTISLRNQGRLPEALQTALALRSRGREPALSAADAIAAPLAGRPAGAIAEAQVLFEMHRYAQAAALFDSLAAALGPGLSHAPGGRVRHQAWMLTHAAVARAAGGDTSRLAADADEVRGIGARSLFGRDVRLHHHLRGLLLAARGDTAGAIVELRRAIYSTTCGYTRTNLELARLLLATGRPVEAVRVLQPALRGPLEASNLYVTHRELHELLARAFAAAGVRDSAAAHRRWVAAARLSGS